jgi:hypothetical protein
MALFVEQHCLKREAITDKFSQNALYEFFLCYVCGTNDLSQFFFFRNHK